MMRNAGPGMIHIMECWRKVERLQEHLERHGTETHLKEAIKHGLLASRSVIDSVLEILEEEETLPKARKINISNE